MRRTHALCLALVCAAAVCGARNVFAQNGPFRFGPPLRDNIVFTYKYVERVTELVEAEGQLVDSSRRIVTYYISERQLPARDKGLISVEVIVDSMEIDRRGMGEPLYFNTQQIAHASDQRLVSHRDVFAPSILVNRMVTFVMTSYGQILRVESPSRKQALQDIESAPLDPFTRERLRATLADEYLASVMLPWRNVVPFGQKVAFDKPQRIPFWTAFDRVSFRDTALVTLVKAPDGAAHIRFSAQLTRPLTSMVTMSAFEEPLKLDGAKASVAGDLTLEEDGVVRSGWTTMTGTLTARRNGRPAKSTVTHEVFIESMGMTPAISNN